MRTETKKAPFLPLVYRWFLLVKKNLSETFLVTAIGYCICIMFSLSSVYGNIAKSTNDVSLALKGAMPAVRLVAIIISFMVFMNSSDLSFDLSNKTWRLFRISSPVTPFRMVLSRFVLMFVSLLISVGTAFLYCAVDNAIYPEFAGYNYGGVIIAIGALLTVYNMVLTISVSICNSTDKGGVISTIFMCLLFIPLMKKLSKMEEIDSFEMIEIMCDFCNKYMIWFIFIIIVAFMIGIISQTWCYKRRDK